MVFTLFCQTSIPMIKNEPLCLNTIILQQFNVTASKDIKKKNHICSFLPAVMFILLNCSGVSFRDIGCLLSSIAELDGTQLAESFQKS